MGHWTYRNPPPPPLDPLQTVGYNTVSWYTHRGYFKQRVPSDVTALNLVERGRWYFNPRQKEAEQQNQSHSPAKHHEKRFYNTLDYTYQK